RHRHHSVARDHAFFQRGQRDRGLDCRARDETVRKGQLLVHYGKDAAGVGINGHYGAVIVPQRLDGSLANDWVVTISDSSAGGIDEGGSPVTKAHSAVP